MIVLLLVQIVLIIPRRGIVILHAVIGVFVIRFRSVVLQISGSPFLPGTVSPT